jgi:type VI secretion system protein ImpA
MDPLLTNADTFFTETFGIGCATLLAPIDPSEPQGEALRGTPLWQAIRRAREADDASVPLGAWVRQLKRAAWGEVAVSSINAIAQRSKDLQIAAWMTEALLHEHGFQGLAASIALIDALCERYWDVMYPLIVNGDLEHRANLFRWLNEKLIVPVRLVPLTAYGTPAPSAPPTDAPAYTWADCELLRRQQAAPGSAKPGDSDEWDQIDPERFASAMENTPNDVWLALHHSLGAAIRALTKLGSTLDRVFSGDAPGLGTLRGLLEQIQAFVATQLAQRGVTPTAEGEAEAEAPLTPASLDEGRTSVGVRDFDGPGSEFAMRASFDDDASLPVPPVQTASPPSAGSGTAPTAQPSAPLDARKQAYAQLNAAATTLAAIEPHSPVPYLIRRAVEWGSLNTAQLYDELFIQGRGQINVFELLGLGVPQEEEPS